MSNLLLYSEISSLPDNLKKEVLDFVQFLQFKTKANKKIKQRKFGCAKGFFKMSADFDAPLNDFKDYM